MIEAGSSSVQVDLPPLTLAVILKPICPLKLSIFSRDSASKMIGFVNEFQEVICDLKDK
jgi:hypothetical protein